jgi:Ion channel
MTGLMEMPLLAVGISLILAGIVDVFFTVLHPDGFGFLSSRLYKLLFVSMRFLTRPLPPRFRALGLSMAAPLMVPMIITVWIALILTGYAFVYFAGMTSESFNFSNPGLEPSLREDLYLSGTAISTLGFGDVTPAGGLYQTLAVSEALIGFGILTLVVSYVVGLYGVVQHLGVLGAGLLHQASDTAEPLSILAPHFPDGELRDIDPILTSWVFTAPLWSSTRGSGATPSSTTTTADGPTARYPTPSAWSGVWPAPCAGDSL